MSFIKQHPVLLLFVLIVAIVAGFTFDTYQANQAQRQGRGWGGPVQVVTDRVSMQQIVDQVEAIGTAQANESVSLTSKVTDTVRKVNFEDGDFIHEGTILVELTNSEETAQLSEAQATLDEATRQYNRVKNLIDQGLASELQLDEEQARMQTATARLEAIVARLDDRLIRAPFSGLLGFRNVSPGTLLSPNTVVTTLDDISQIKLDFSIPENYLAVISQGQELEARSVAYEDQVFSGTVATISSRVDPVTRSVTVRALINNEAGLLRPGMLLTVQLIRNRGEALMVSEQAIVPVQNRHFVYKVNAENTAERVPVEIGRTRPGLVEVLSGLDPGDEVVIEGVIKVNPGSKIIRQGEEKPAAQRGGSGGWGG